MRHTRKRLQLGRFGAWRKATLKGLARSLFIYQSIRTTKARAMAVKPLVDQLISLAKENTLAARRRSFKILQDHRLVSMLFSDIGPRFDKRKGGYTRVLNLGPRRGDSASMAILELVEIKKKERRHPKKALKGAQPEAVDKRPEPAKEATEPIKEKPAQEKKAEVKTKEREKPPIQKKEPTKKFLGGLRSIFKKERDSL
ncbi:MAG: 50S ribosomal protein L17 [Candidatus Omnitrophica bacterium]|nr:50S ribosomal protein L17 [Candidatus Omnitrophota bacterium]